MAFKPEDYWVIYGEASHGEDDPFKVSHTTARFWDKDAADAAYANVAQARRRGVTAVERRAAPSAHPRLSNTTSLQAAAAAGGISPARTMRLAESLYMTASSLPTRAWTTLSIPAR